MKKIKNDHFKIALVGNPNSGKTTLFNALTKTLKKTGNYPGVTIEKETGYFSIDKANVSIIDLPGCYTLNAYSQDEKVSSDYLLKNKPDLVVNVIDSSNLERGLFLTTELVELEIPILIVCNKTDLAKAHGIEIDHKKLADRLEIEVIPYIAVKKDLDKLLKKKIYSYLKNKSEVFSGVFFKFSEKINKAISDVQNVLEDMPKSRYFALKCLESTKNLNNLNLSIEKIEEIKRVKNEISEENFSEILTLDRNNFCKKICKEVEKTSKEYFTTSSDKIDKIALNKYFGFPIFLIIIFLLFQFTFSFGAVLSKPLSYFFEKSSLFFSLLLKNYPLVKSLVVDGIISGVGSVLSLLPNILFLFIGISILEESGYMARCAYLMDRYMHRLGLHGKSFIPMIIGFGCSVPAIESTRILENKKNRMATIFILPLIACSAKLAVFTMLLPAFFSPLMSGIILFIFYICGICLSFVIIKVLKKTVLKGENIPFIMEMPAYSKPNFINIFKSTWQKAKFYVKKAGSFILAISIILWFLSFFPVNKNAQKVFQEKLKEKNERFIQNINELFPVKTERNVALNKFIKEISNQKNIKGYFIDLTKDETFKKILEKNNLKAEKFWDYQNRFNKEILNIKNIKLKNQLKHSYLGKVGSFLSPIFSPLGFDWKINTAILSALSAKEVFISQMGIILSSEKKEVKESLTQKLKENYSALQAISIMIFILVSMPCLATFATVKKETGYFFVAISQFLGLTLLAYLLSLLIFQIGNIF